MFERYQGKAAFDAHNEQPIIQKLIHEWKYIRGVKAWFPPANLDTTTRLPELQSTQGRGEAFHSRLNLELVAHTHLGR
jgi:hypothetical protein